MPPFYPPGSATDKPSSRLQCKSYPSNMKSTCVRGLKGFLGKTYVSWTRSMLQVYVFVEGEEARFVCSEVSCRLCRRFVASDL